MKNFIEITKDNGITLININPIIYVNQYINIRIHSYIRNGK